MQRNAQSLDSDCPRRVALKALVCPDIDMKCQLAKSLKISGALDTAAVLEEPESLSLSPGRPARPILVAPNQLKPRGVQTQEGRATLLHALAHIEFNAINLALDIVWRFAGMPTSFYRDWLLVAHEEAYHFGLLRARLADFGVEAI
jgi:uncharacterized ferritin-like protein (DUF455 family)